MPTYVNYDHKGEAHDSSVQAFTSKEITAPVAGDVVVKNSSGAIANLYVLTAGVSVTVKDGSVAIRPPLTGVDEDDFQVTPFFCGTSIVLNFSTAGTAYIMYK